MRTGFITCDWCKSKLIHPALLAVKMMYRANVPLGFVEVEVIGDFCDVKCLEHYALAKAEQINYQVARADQSVFYRE